MEDFGWFGDEGLHEVEPFWMDDLYQLNQREADDYRNENSDEEDYEEDDYPDDESQLPDDRSGMYNALEAEDRFLDARYEEQFEMPEWDAF